MRGRHFSTPRLVLAGTLGLAATLLSAAVPPGAHADDAARARFHGELARRHYEADRYDDALLEFFAVQSLSPNPRVLFNIAVCFDQLERADDAFLFFSEYLDGDDEDAQRRAFATAALERLGSQVARVRVSTTPDAGDVFVDRRDHGSYGHTPRLLAIAPGEHRIVIEREGYRPFQTTVTAERGREVEVEATLEQVLGGLSVGDVEGTLTVRDQEGRSVYEGPAAEVVTLPPGSYAIEVVSPGHLPWRSVALVSGDRTTTTTPSLTALPPPTGALTVTSNASGALLHIDGEPSGFVPMALGDVGVGTHRVRLEHDGLQPWEGDVAIAADECAWLTVTLGAPVRVERSPWTWVSGGIGAAALVAGLVVAGFAVDAYDRYGVEAVTSDPMGLRDLQGRGESLNIASDVLIITGLVGLATATLLYFLTESRTEERSEATTAREAR